VVLVAFFILVHVAPHATELGISATIAAFGFTVGGAIGPVLAGRLFDIMGSYQVDFLVCAALAVIACILASLLRPSSREGGRE